jgi:hypothetical protein
MLETPLATTVVSDAAITEDTLCARCGYNLRGLATSGSCPECNAPISQSVQGNLLRFADPDWLAKLRSGVTIKLWNLVIGLVGGFLMAILVLVGVPTVAAALIALASAGLGLWAAFLITTQEPRISMAEDTVSLRRVVRAFAALGLAGALLEHTGPVTAYPLVVMVLGQSLGGLAAVVSYFGEFVYLRRFARRVPDERMVRATTWVMWGLVLSMIAGLAGAVTAAVAGAAAAGPVSAIGTGGGALLGCFGGLALLAFGLWYLMLLFDYRNAFTTASRQSRLGAVQSQARAAEESSTAPPSPGSN